MDCRICFLAFLLFTTTAAAQLPARHAVVINEILFNPKPSAYDYIELYNRSDSTVDLRTLHLTNRSASGQYGVLKKLTDTARYLLPHAYVVFTENAANLALHYFVKAPAAVVEMASLPSYPNAAGTVVLLDTLKNGVDEVPYAETWQFGLLADAEGVALERIDPDGASNEKTNWHSAASDAGYGTPGYQNSQYKLFQNPIASIGITPKLFSPDGDGTDDVLTIAYAVPENGTVANVFIYDASGRQRNHLVKGAVLGTTGSFTWNGLDARGQRLPVGQYIIYTELFTLQGKKHRFKNVVVLARWN